MADEATWPVTERSLVEIQIYSVFAKYDLFESLITYKYEFWYNFDTVLYQFLETGSSDWTNIDQDQRLKFLGFILYPLSFKLSSPCKW